MTFPNLFKQTTLRATDPLQKKKEENPRYKYTVTYTLKFVYKSYGISG